MSKMSRELRPPFVVSLLLAAGGLGCAWLFSVVHDPRILVLAVIATVIGGYFTVRFWTERGALQAAQSVGKG